MASHAMDRLLRQEQAVSAAINAVLSAAFFALVFGLGERQLTIAAPDRFALDFLPQGLMVSLMASLVPALLVRAKLRKMGCFGLGSGPSGGAVRRIVAKGVLLGLASAALLAALALFGPLHAVSSHPALAFKIVYGAALGLLCTRLALTGLFGTIFREHAA
ncbi:hypothetical protein EDF56_103375 [Novosphingobium sp. PhB165]|uniref:hypothetical protein n=1 Tax=Novosphingobium sp. PhB165 TaxID=2485105 RepID=UPI0010D12B20|nr:hypothetical protein [Novosphingobium sp. PhB165]TCM19732.1 hypothetical protein EDF56_103375 [Novosphingobium sp. PhB165]